MPSATSPASTVMTPLVVSDALDGANAWVDAADVTTALALLLAPLSVSDIWVTAASDVAWF